VKDFQVEEILPSPYRFDGNDLKLSIAGHLSTTVLIAMFNIPA